MSAETGVINQAIILAGGLGSRLKSVVSDRPKPMALVAGRPFLAYQIEYLIAQGVQRVVLSVGYKKEQIIRHFAQHYSGIEIAYGVEENPMGTGGGLLLALQQSDQDEAVLVVNGDTWFPLDIAPMMHLHQKKQADVTLALRKGAGEGRYGGIDLDGFQRIVNFSSQGERGDYINGGAYLVSPACQRRWLAQGVRKCSLETDLLERGISEGLHCFGFPSDAAFIDIGLPADYARAANVINPK